MAPLPALYMAIMGLTTVEARPNANLPCEALGSDLVATALVEREEARISLNETPGVIGWIYYLNPIEEHNSKNGSSRAVVFTGDSRSPVLLRSGATYAVFANLNSWGVFELNQFTRKIDPEYEGDWIRHAAASCTPPARSE